VSRDYPLYACDNPGVYVWSPGFEFLSRSITLFRFHTASSNLQKHSKYVSSDVTYVAYGRACIIHASRFVSRLVWYVSNG
jgi:hypothetical protein